MKTPIQDYYDGASKLQLDYLTNLIKNSDAESICELGTFVGTTAKHIWQGIKDTGKKMYLVDNYLFLPEQKREQFFNFIIKSIDPDTKNIIPVLQSTHEYDWTQHDFILFGHHDADHFWPDYHTLINSNVKYAFIGDGYEKDFNRYKGLQELVANKKCKLRPIYHLHGIYVFGQNDIHCDLPTKDGIIFDNKVKYIPKISGKYIDKISNIVPNINNVIKDPY